MENKELTKMKILAFIKSAKTEIIIIVVFILAMFFATITINNGLTEIKKQGGFRGIIIAIGKDIKSIAKEINQEDKENDK